MKIHRRGRRKGPTKRRLVAYVPETLAARLDEHLKREYGDMPPYGVVTALLNRLLAEYLEAAERTGRR